MGFGDGWDEGGAGEASEAGEGAARILNDHALFAFLGRRLVEEEGSVGVLFTLAVEATVVSLASKCECRASIRKKTYISVGHDSANVRMRSGLVSASSLYTLQLLLNLLCPPSAAVSRHRSAITSPLSVWKTCLSVV